MSAPFVIAVPAKGRLQENAEAFFARAGLELVKPRGARDYRGAIADLPGVEVAFLSAAEIAQLLAQGAVHFGLTGEDLIREMIPDADAKVARQQESYELGSLDWTKIDASGTPEQTYASIVGFLDNGLHVMRSNLAIDHPNQNK